MLELKKIDLPFASDLLTEKFDDILELIHPNAFVYGGALRDIAAGLPLEGDLDIVVSGKDYDYCISRITKSAKWRSYYSRYDPLMKQDEKTGYRHSKIISNVSVFETFGNRKVELVRAKAQFSKGYISASLEVVKAVDIKCCGLVMDIYGNAFEVVEGAHQDCLDRVLRLNKLDSGFNIENLKSRIAKLKDRGWTSKVNISKATKTLEKIEEAAKKEYMKKMASVKQNQLKMSLKRRSSDTFEVVIRGLGDEQLHTPNINSAVRNAMKGVEYKLPFITAQGGGSVSIQFQTAGVKINANVKKSMTKIGKAVMMYIKDFLLQKQKEMLNSGNLSDLLRTAPASKYRKYAKTGRVKASRGGSMTTATTQIRSGGVVGSRIREDDRPVEVTRSGETIEIERDRENHEVEEQDVPAPEHVNIASNYESPNGTVGFETSPRAMSTEEVAERYEDVRYMGRDDGPRVDRGIRIPEQPPQPPVEHNHAVYGEQRTWSNAAEEVVEEFEVIRPEPTIQPDPNEPMHDSFFATLNSLSLPGDENSEDDPGPPEEDG